MSNPFLSLCSVTRPRYAFVVNPTGSTDRFDVVCLALVGPEKLRVNGPFKGSHIGLPPVVHLIAHTRTSELTIAEEVDGFMGCSFDVSPPPAAREYAEQLRAIKRSIDGNPSAAQ